MKILARGTNLQTEELKQKLSSVDIDLICEDENTISVCKDETFLAIFDLNADDAKFNPLAAYNDLITTPVFVAAVKKSLAMMAQTHQQKINFPLFGINALPTFINRSIAEISVFNLAQKNRIETIFSSLSWNFKLVDDRVGMVTPRVLFMIINEACYTLEEETASINDIDIAMKLGTNYPFGPFEWADKIGIKPIYETLNALFEDTQDERYKICPLLKTKYLRGEKFF